MIHHFAGDCTIRDISRRDDVPTVRRDRAGIRQGRGSVTTVGLVEEYLWRHSYDARRLSVCIPL